MFSQVVEVVEEVEVDGVDGPDGDFEGLDFLDRLIFENLGAFFEFDYIFGADRELRLDASSHEQDKG